MIRVQKTAVSTLLLALMLAALVAAPLPAAAIQQASAEAKKAEAMLGVAEKACGRLGVLINMVEANQTAMAAVQATGLQEAFNANVSLYEQAKSLLEEAEEAFKAGNYSLALNCTMQAMRLTRDAFKGAKAILEQTGIEKGELVQAQGLIEASKRALERVDRLEQALPENASDVQAVLNQAKSMLNVTEITQLLLEGNVTAAAHRLAEANKLIAEAFKAVKAKAEEELAERAEKFLGKLEQLRQKVSEELEKAGVNASQIFEGMGNFSRQQIAEKLRGMKPDELKEVIKGDLKIIGVLLRDLKDAVPKLKGLEKPKIADILSNPKAWEGKTVYVEGEYCGWQAPEGVPGPSFTGPPETKSDWIISDGTGWIYVTGKQPELRPLPLIRPQDQTVGVRVAVVGEVKVKTIDGSDVPYVKAKAVIPLPITVPHPPTLPPINELLNVTVEKEAVDGKVVLHITITNYADEAAVFPDGAYGVVILRKVGDLWVPHHVPVSVLVLMRLQPSQSASITVALKKPPAGTYRVVSIGWLEKSHMLVTGFAEFILP